MKSTALQTALEEFEVAGRAKGLSPRTLNGAYGYPLREFMGWAAGQGITDPGDLDQRTLDRWMVHLRTDGGIKGPLKPATIHSYARAVNAFLGWLRQDGEHDVRGKAKLPQLRRQVLDVLSPEEMRRLEDAAEAERDKLLVRLLADTGIRVGELIKLTTGDLVESGRDRFLKIEGKGGRDRLVPIAPRIHARLDRYIRRTRPHASSDRIFVGLRRGRSGDYEPLTSSGVEQLVRVLGEKAGIKRRVHPHLFRHSAITDQLRKGVNPLLVAKNAGHSSLSMIARTYSHLDAGDVASAMAEYLRKRDESPR